MPKAGEAKSAAQRDLFAIAEHKPDILYDKDKPILGSMSKKQMHNFAATKGLKREVKPKKFTPDGKARVQPKKFAPPEV